MENAQGGKRINRRKTRRSTAFTSPIPHWAKGHDDQRYSYAILGLVRYAQRINVSGQKLRRTRARTVSQTID